MIARDSSLPSVHRVEQIAVKYTSRDDKTWAEELWNYYPFHQKEEWELVMMMRQTQARVVM